MLRVNASGILWTGGRNPVVCPEDPDRVSGAGLGRGPLPHPGGVFRFGQGGAYVLGALPKSIPLGSRPAQLSAVWAGLHDERLGV